jgi:hypothetical protein
MRGAVLKVRLPSSAARAWTHKGRTSVSVGWDNWGSIATSCVLVPDFAMRQEVWEGLAAPDDGQQLVIDMEVFIGSGARRLPTRRRYVPFGSEMSQAASAAGYQKDHRVHGQHRAILRSNGTGGRIGTCLHPGLQDCRAWEFFRISAQAKCAAEKEKMSRDLFADQVVGG